MPDSSHRVEPLRGMPANAHDFLAETAHGLRGLYGAAAADEYLANAPGLLRGTLAHPAVRAFAAEGSDGETQAIVIAVMKPPIAQLVYLHVLERHAGQGAEAALLEQALERLRHEPIEGITAEYLATAPLEVDSTYRKFGFVPEQRTLMLAPLDAPALQTDGSPVSAPIANHEWGAAARILVDAYREHPGRRLHLEVRDETQAAIFLQSAANGGYGAFEPGFARLHRSTAEHPPDGMVIGSRAAPGVGFVLHVAVPRANQGRGIGQQLVCDLAHAFRLAGYDRAALGVTDGNPARRLYERLGFEPVRQLTAWYWWREEKHAP